MVYYISIFVVSTILVFTTSHAFVVSPSEVMHLNSGYGVGKPSGAVMIREGVACARAQQETCEDCLHESTALCSFDGGRSISIYQTRHPFCGDRGAVVGERLLCPLLTKAVSKSVINVTVVSYSAASSLVETVEDVVMLSFVSPPDVAVVDIEFKGSTVFFPEENLYFMNVVLLLENASSSHVLFRSENGYVWNAWGPIPLNVTDMSFLTRQGEERITVSVYAAGEHHIVSTSYKAIQWGHPRSVNASVAPAAIFLGSGIVFDSGLSNQTDVLQLRGFVEGKSKSKNISSLIDFYKAVSTSNQIPEDFTAGCEGGEPCLTSSQVALISFQPNQITALFDFVSTGTHKMSIAGVTINVDASEEKNAILKRKEMEEARKVAQEAAAKKREKERQKRREKEKERRKLFADADTDNINFAISRLPEDGEMIVVRDVLEDFIDIEKQTFFW